MLQETRAKEEFERELLQAIADEDRRKEEDMEVID